MVQHVFFFTLATSMLGLRAFRPQNGGEDTNIPVTTGLWWKAR
jgi:hypothetical protein